MTTLREMCQRVDPTGELSRLLDIVEATADDLSEYQGRTGDVDYVRGVVERWRRFTDAITNVRAMLDLIEAELPK